MSENTTNLEIDAILAELEQNYPGITDEQIAQVQSIEAAELEECFPDEDITSDNAWGWARKQENVVSVKQYEPALKSVARASATTDRQKAADTKRKKSIDKKKRKREIINAAITSSEIDLNAPLTVECKKLLITALTKQYTDRMVHHDKYINATIEMALRKGIPHDLLNIFSKFPDTVVPFPGFVYNASAEYGQSLSFKVYPNVPFYFKPEDCNSVIRKLLSPDRLMSLDKAVVFFHKYKDTRSKQEIKIAEALTKVHTYFQLVKKDAFWYEILMNELKNQLNGL